jgi:hypothetical protein
VQLAVQAATSSSRHASLQALITLQLQLHLGRDSVADPVFNSRLSRVVTKLFARVVKAEEAALIPFSPSSMDMEAVLCCLEDTLTACDKAEQNAHSEDGVTASRSLATVLVTAILKARGGPSSIRWDMQQLGIDPQSSALGAVVTQCAPELERLDSPSRVSSRDVASLVSAIGSARQGSERDAAISALRRYKSIHGDEQLNAHLTDVSAAFRAFVLDQLKVKPLAISGAESSNASSMSERIKSLRSKLTATEAAVQSAVDTADTKESRKPVVEEQPTSFRSSLAMPSPSKLPAASSATTTTTTTTKMPAPSSSDAGPSSVRDFRDRLAAAQGKRSSGGSTGEGFVQPTAPAGGRAAALRARLQAVKRQSEQE